MIQNEREFFQKYGLQGVVLVARLQGINLAIKEQKYSLLLACNAQKRIFFGDLIEGSVVNGELLQSVAFKQTTLYAWLCNMAKTCQFAFVCRFTGNLVAPTVILDWTYNLMTIDTFLPHLFVPFLDDEGNLHSRNAFINVRIFKARAPLGDLQDYVESALPILSARLGWRSKGHQPHKACNLALRLYNSNDHYRNAKHSCNANCRFFVAPPDEATARIKKSGIIPQIAVAGEQHYTEQFLSFRYCRSDNIFFKGRLEVLDAVGKETNEMREHFQRFNNLYRPEPAAGQNVE